VWPLLRLLSLLLPLMLLVLPPMVVQPAEVRRSSVRQRKGQGSCTACTI
jgi:hypothetical protein